MKPRTTAQLNDVLDRELAWRRREIITFGQEVRRASPPWQTTLIRAAVPLLYAHWEGFVKIATESVIDFVSARRFTYKRLKRQYWAIGLKGRLTSLDQVSPRERVETVEYVLSMSDRVTRFRAHEHVTTEGNLSSKVFVRIASTIGVDPSGYEVRFPLLDRELLARRNHIAHGQHLEIDADAFLALEQEMLNLLRQYHTDLQNYVVLEAYLDQ